MPPATSWGTPPDRSCPADAECDQHHQTECIDYTGEKLGNPAYDLLANLYNNYQIVKNLLAIAMGRKILRGGANVAALCAVSGTTTTTRYLTRGPLCSEECSQQHLSLPSAGARPLRAERQLKTIQKDSYDTDKDVRDSLEIQEVKKEQRKATATHQVIAQRTETVS